MLKSSIIFLNGPEDELKTRFIAKLRRKFETACVMIKRKDLLHMMSAYESDYEKTESLEWLAPKILKNILNNGVFVLFDAFLPARRVNQYVSQMHGLPCYWIGVFFKEHDAQFYDLTVTLDENTDLDTEAESIFEFISNNAPGCFEAMRSIEFVARKREIVETDRYYQKIQKNRPVFATPEEKRLYKENKFRSLKNKYSNTDDRINDADAEYNHTQNYINDEYVDSTKIEN